WINDMHPRMVMHPIKAELNGQDLSDNKDPTGKRLFVEFVETVKRQGSGFVRYQWPKPGMEKPQPKLSYVAGFAPWGWVIGTGVYGDALEAQLWSVARTALIAPLTILLAVGIISVVVARRTGGAIRDITTSVGRLADGDTGIAVPGLGRADEIGDLAAALEVFKENMIKAERLRAEFEESQQRAHAEKKAGMERLADTFEAAVVNIVDQVSSASTELEAAASTLTHTADTTQTLSATVASASEVASSNVQSVATATEQMNSAVNEIARQVQES